MRIRRVTTAAAAIAVAAALVAPTGALSPANAAVNAKTAQSAAAFGGIKGLVAACKKEGQLNVIALPRDWANYGAILDSFKNKYKVKIDEQQPTASSQDEINAANQLKGTKRAPDVFDIGQAVKDANIPMFAPYKVVNWNQIPDGLKDKNGRWVGDYGGYMAVGYDANRVPAPTTLEDLMKPAYKGVVALNGDPRKAAAGMNGVFMATLASGGTLDDITKGVDYFKRLKAAGSMVLVDPTPATVQSGQTAVVFDWDYNHTGQVEKLKAVGIDWKIFIPKGVALNGGYFQAINKDAPHPACARLWQEHLYSPESQNNWLKGGSRPVMADAMAKAGTINKTLWAALPKVTGKPVTASSAQTTKAAEYLAANWAAAVGAA